MQENPAHYTKLEDVDAEAMGDRQHFDSRQGMCHFESYEMKYS